MSLPIAISPMLVSSAPRPPDRDDFTYEVKWDGVRCIAFIEDEVRLQSRNLRPIGGRFPEVATALSGLPRGTVLDGELIVFDHDAPNFERVRRRLTLEDPRKIARAVAGERAVFMAFDLLFAGGESLLRVPFEERRGQLEETCPEGGHLALSPRFENGPALFEAVCAQGLEGIIAKRRDSLYLPGKRSCAWVKCKTSAAREEERLRRAVWFH